MAVMNKKLQISTINRLLARKGIATDTVDLEALVDENLSLPENITNVEKELGFQLRTSDEDVAEVMRDMENVYQTPESINEEIEETYDEAKRERELLQLSQEIDMQLEKITSKDPFFFAKYFFPDLVGEQYDDVRRSALLCAATAGFETSRVRRRLHMLLVGPPGCGKTEILLWFNRHLNAHFVSAEFATKVGLSGDARGGEVTPGALAEADGGIICIDELDRLAHNDQNALLQAMEEGTYIVVKGKHRQRLRANVVVIASANEKKKIQKPLLDRFDFVHELRTPTREERMKTVPTLVETFFSQTSSQEKVLRHYLNFVQNHEPKVSDEVKERISKLIMTYIRIAKSDITQFSYRSLELSILRVAYAIAKLQRSDLKEEHVNQAISLKDPEYAAEVEAVLKAHESGLLA